jgi:Amt family ammonium transporter
MDFILERDVLNLLNVLWIVISAALVFIMQGGFALVESGLTRSKNSINVAIKNLTDLGVSVLAFWLVGFAIMFGLSESGVFGTKFFFFEFANLKDGAFFIFQAMFCSTAATIVSGAVAERMKYSSYILSTLLLSAFFYPIIGHWAWGSFFMDFIGLEAALEAMGLVPGTPEANAMAPLIENSKGWLENLGFVDFAGSTVVHSLGGWIALAALIIIGPRRGRFKKDGTIGKINASNVPAAVLGVLILWFGWFGFNGGSTLGWTDAVPGILIRTTIAAAAGMVVTLAVGWPLTKVPDVNFVINGALAGLVAITAPVAVVDTWDSIIIGGVGGLVMLFANWLMEKQKIDDAVGAIPVHMAAGVWGTLSVAFFGETGKPWLEQLWVQALGIVSIGGFAFWGSLLFLWVFNKIKPLRVTEEQELQGLNVAEHGASTELMDLTFVMEEQAKSEDLSLRAPEDPFTEVGQIGQEYNRVIGHLQDNLVAKSEYINILDNVSDGLFLSGRSRETSAHTTPAPWRRSSASKTSQGSLWRKSFFPW